MRTFESRSRQKRGVEETLLHELAWVEAVSRGNIPISRTHGEIVMLVNMMATEGHRWSARESKMRNKVS
jgi:hypothetical protein